MRMEIESLMHVNVKGRGRAWVERIATFEGVYGLDRVAYVRFDAADGTMSPERKVWFDELEPIDTDKWPSVKCKCRGCR